NAAHFDGAGAPLFEGCVVEISGGIGVNDIVGKLRRNRGIDGEAANAALGHVGQHALETLDVEGLGKNVLHGFANERVVGKGDLAIEIFRTGERFGKNGGEQIIGAHALNVWWDFLSVAKTEKRERAAGIPAPAS